jgi:hypothetical protein
MKKAEEPITEEEEEEIGLIKHYLGALGYDYGVLKKYDITNKNIREWMLTELRVEYLNWVRSIG